MPGRVVFAVGYLPFDMDHPQGLIRLKDTVYVGIQLGYGKYMIHEN